MCVAGVHNHYVIHVSAVKNILIQARHIMVKIIQVKVRENLTGQITDRKAFALTAVKQALRLWQARPIVARTPNFTIVRRIVAQDFLYHIKNGRFRRVEKFLINQVLYLFIQNVLVNVKEKAVYVQTQNVTIRRVRVRTSFHHLRTIQNAVQSPLPRATAVRRIRKDFFKNRHQASHNQVVDDSVAEIRGKDFPLDRMADNKRLRRIRSVFPAGNFFVQLHQAPFVLTFKTKRRQTAPFLFATIQVRIKNFVQSQVRQ